MLGLPVVVNHVLSVTHSRFMLIIHSRFHSCSLLSVHRSVWFSVPHCRLICSALSPFVAPLGLSSLCLLVKCFSFCHQALVFWMLGPAPPVPDRIRNNIPTLNLWSWIPKHQHEQNWEAPGDERSVFTANKDSELMQKCCVRYVFPSFNPNVIHFHLWFFGPNHDCSSSVPDSWCKVFLLVSMRGMKGQTCCFICLLLAFFWPFSDMIMDCVRLPTLTPKY